MALMIFFSHTFYARKMCEKKHAENFLKHAENFLFLSRNILAGNFFASFLRRQLFACRYNLFRQVYFL